MFEDLMADAASGRVADDHVISLTSGVTAGLSRRLRAMLVLYRKVLRTPAEVKERSRLRKWRFNRSDV
jgi:hypothetical protein